MGFTADPLVLKDRSMTLPPFLGNDGRASDAWANLVNAIPTLTALAQLCADRLQQGPVSDQDLSLSAEALTLLYAARDRGVFEIKGTNKEFESQQRLLAVYVEQSHDEYLMFRSRDDAEITIRFLDAFRELCAAGMLIHQCAAEFSLSRLGFERARSVDADACSELLEEAVRA